MERPRAATPGISPKGKAERKAEFIGLRAKGVSLRACAGRLQTSTSTLCNWEQELAAEISRLKAIELEAIYEEFALSKEHRLRILGERIAGIRREICSRELSNVDTVKLLEVLLRYLEQVGRAYVEPKFISDSEIEAMKNKTGTNLNAVQITQEIESVLLRYRAGLLDAKQTATELSLLQPLQRGAEHRELQTKLDKLSSLLEGGK